MHCGNAAKTKAMPELPEVETVRREIEASLRDWRVADVSIRRHDIVEWPSGAGTSEKIALLKGATIIGTHRHGKQFAIESSSGRLLRVHLGMSGQFVLTAPELFKLDAHDHVVWTLEHRGEHRTLAYRDPRRFGSLRPFATRAELDDTWKLLGPDALNVSDEAFAELVHKRSRHIKALLLDQASIAGVGNIYADEALFRAGVHPTRISSTLPDAKVLELASAIRDILSEAVRGKGSTIRDYRTSAGDSGSYQDRHLVYGRGGEPCTRCSSVLKQTQVSQRTTVFCARCQPSYRKRK